MSDCEKCWETLCICGHQYRNWSEGKLKDLIKVLVKLYEEKHSAQSVIKVPEVMGGSFNFYLSKVRSNVPFYIQAESKEDLLLANKIKDHFDTNEKFSNILVGSSKYTGDEERYILQIKEGRGAAFSGNYKYGKSIDNWALLEEWFFSRYHLWLEDKLLELYKA